ncbi:MAG: ParB/RepB/Spo0J family partition protein [Calditrichaeota bacterium]|nr:ParB/RepB/Spo0J family partition protein [Calditrichota bacterium]
MKSKSLGRGLSALLPDADKEPTAGLLDIRIKDIKPNPHQPRQSFDTAELDDLTASIKAKGVIQPLVVRAKGGQYTLIAGERRLRAAKQAGLRSVPVRVIEIDDEADMLELSLIENLQRHDLNPVELAEGYRKLQKTWGLTQELIAKRVGKERATVANTLRLLDLPENVQASLRRGEISMGHAKVILSVQGAARQSAFWKRVVKDGLSVRQCEELARSFGELSVKTTLRRKVEETPEIAGYKDRLRRSLGTKVQIHRKGRKGFIRIDYYSNEDLIRLIELIEVKR